jgi:hypothetical protein
MHHIGTWRSHCRHIRPVPLPSNSGMLDGGPPFRCNIFFSVNVKQCASIGDEAKASQLRQMGWRRVDMCLYSSCVSLGPDTRLIKGQTFLYIFSSPLRDSFTSLFEGTSTGNQPLGFG